MPPTDLERGESSTRMPSPRSQSRGTLSDASRISSIRDRLTTVSRSSFQKLSDLRLTLATLLGFILLLALGRAHGHIWVGADVALALPLTLMRAGLADTALPRLYGAPRRSHEGDSARIHGRMRPPAHGLVSACENSTRRNYRPIVQC